MFVESVYSKHSSSRTLQQSIFLLLENCDSIKKLAQIHTQIIIRDFTVKHFILAKLLGLYLSYGKNILARIIFEQTQSPSTTIWNQIIRGYAHSDKPLESVHLFNRMLASGGAPNGFTYSSLISACGRSLFQEGLQVHGKVVANGLSANPFIQTSLVNLYSMTDDEDGIKDARRLFDEMPVRNLVTWNTLLEAYLHSGEIDGASEVFDKMPEKNVVSWTMMISWCAKNGMCNQALSMFKELRREHVGMDQVTLIAALSACAEVGYLDIGRSIHSYIHWVYEAKNLRLPISLQNALIHMYSSCGMAREAYKVFEKMPKRSTVSWTSMIAGFAKQGKAEEALDTFSCMQTQEIDVKPDASTLIAVLSACSHGGFVDEGQYIFENMVQLWGIVPQIKHYGCMVDILSRAGLFEEASRLIQSMPMSPNNAIWGAVLGACRTYKNLDLVSHVTGDLMVERDPEKAAGYLILLENVFAMGGQWRDVIPLRHKLKQLGFKKPVGRSCIQINGIVHQFVAGDITHKDISSVYEMIVLITCHSRLKYEINCSDVVMYGGLR